LLGQNRYLDSGESSLELQLVSGLTVSKNKMTVTECAVGIQKMTADAAKNSLDITGNTAIGQLRTVAGLCNTGQFDKATMDRPLHERVVHGDATDQATLRFSELLGPVSELRRCWHTKYQLAFNSKNKYMIRALGLVNPDGLAMALPVHIAAIYQPGDM
jgi:sodium/potassium-transporting ATPase subunit alpha